MGGDAVRAAAEKSMTGASSGPKLDGVLLTDGNVLSVRHEAIERAPIGPEDLIEAVEILSK